jgi:hypothetical protein
MAAHLFTARNSATRGLRNCLAAPDPFALLPHCDGRCAWRV